MFEYFGVLVNTVTVTAGSLMGLFVKKRSKNITESKEEPLSQKMMVCLGFCTVFAATSGLVAVSSGVDALITVASLVIGLLIGTLLKIDDRLNSLGDVIIRKLPAKGNKENPAVGFVTACLLFCIGSMTVVGSFESAANTENTLIVSKHTTLLIKSMLDLVSSTCLAATYGFCITASALFVLVFQGFLVFLAGTIQPFLNQIGAMTAINAAGSILLLVIACNLTGIKKIKTGDYLPAIFMPILICSILNLW